MRSSSSQARLDRNTYIPPHVQQAMNQHMQQSMPAHLKKYVGGNAAYVPRHMESAVNQAIQKNMPAHLKQYAGAYMQQNVIQPNTGRLHGPTNINRPVTPHAPLPDKLRRGHSMPSGEQHTVELNTLPNDQSLFQTDQAQPEAQQPQPPQPAGPYHPDYDFFMSQQPPQKKSLLPGGFSSSPLGRIAVILAVIFVLLVGLAIVKNVLSGSTNLDSFVTIAQEQQELIHLTSNAAEQTDLSETNKNFAATAELSLNSSQSDLLKYLSDNHKKISVKQLNLKLSSAVDQQLDSAEAAGNYNQAFKEILSSRLSQYATDLQRVYQSTEGPKGRELLSDNYTQAKLMLEQLQGSSATGN